MSCRGVALRPRLARRGACGCVTPVELVRIVKEQRSAASRRHGTGSTGIGWITEAGRDGTQQNQAPLMQGEGRQRDSGREANASLRCYRDKPSTTV